MKIFHDVFRWFIAGVTYLVTYSIGGVDMALSVLLFCITFDYITGVLSAIVNKELSSAIGYKGIFKKVGILIAVALGHLIGVYLNFEVRAWVIGYYIANEGISILENLGYIGVPYPERFLNVLKQLKKESGSDDDK